MSLLAIDLGNCNVVGAVPRGKGIDVVVSDSSSKVIPSVVSYTSERRYFADYAAAQKISNRQQCFTHLPLVVGEAYDSPAVQRARYAGAQYNINELNGRAVSHIAFGGENLSLEFDQAAAALIGQMKKYAEAMDKVMPQDFVLAIPAHWPIQKKMKFMAAGKSTGLNCLGVISQQAAASVNYYMRRVAEFQKLPDGNQGVRIGFLAVGEIESWAAIAYMNKQGVTILSYVADQELGSIDFDKIIADLILQKAVQKSKQITRDELLSKKSQIKIMKAANQCKKILSLNSNAPAVLECVGDSQIDIYVLISQQEFDQRCNEIKLVQRVDYLLSKAIEQAGIKDIKEIEAFEAIGGASRVRSVYDLLAARFADRISRRLNADEAIAVGACWIGAMRSSKHHIPFDIKVVDLTVNLEDKVSFQVYNQDGTPVFESAFEMFKPGDIYPKSKKVTLRFASGEYTARLFDGKQMLEELKFQVKEKNLVQFNAHKEFAQTNGVKFDDLTVQLKIKVTADENGFFKIGEIQRNDYDLVFDDVKKQVPNENYDAENKSFEEAKAKIEAEYSEKMKSFDELNAVYEQKAKDYEEAKKAAKDDTPVPAPEMQKPVKPVKQQYPPVPRKEKEITEKVPRIANYSRDVAMESLFYVYNQNESAKLLMEFEQKCKQVDRAALRYDAAVNRLDSLIYQTREAFDYGNLHEFITEEEKTLIHQWLEQAGIYRNDIQGRHQTEEIEIKSTELEGRLQPYYNRKSGYQQAEERIFMLKSEVGNLETRFQEPENAQRLLSLQAAYEALCQRFQCVDKKVQLDDGFFKEFLDAKAAIEQEMLKQQADIAEAKKKAEEAAKAAESSQKSSQPTTPAAGEKKAEKSE